MNRMTRMKVLIYAYESACDLDGDVVLFGDKVYRVFIQDERVEFIRYATESDKIAWSQREENLKERRNNNVKTNSK